VDEEGHRITSLHERSATPPPLPTGRAPGYYIDVHQLDEASSILLTPVAAPLPQLGRLPQLLKVLADPTRLRIVGLLAQRELCVCDIEQLLGVSQSMTSHHLGVLRRAGLLLQRREERDARWVYYRLNPETVGALREQVATLLDLTNFDGTPAHCD
jgi:ArsR family transcriptional regulator